MNSERKKVVEKMQEFDAKMGKLPDDYQWDKDKRFLVSYSIKASNIIFFQILDSYVKQKCYNLHLEEDPLGEEHKAQELKKWQENLLEETQKDIGL